MKRTRSATSPAKRHLVRDNDHRHPVRGKRSHHSEHFAHQLRIERGRHLVDSMILGALQVLARFRPAALWAAAGLERPVGKPPIQRARDYSSAAFSASVRDMPRALRGASATFVTTRMREQVQVPGKPSQLPGECLWPPSAACDFAYPPRPAGTGIPSMWISPASISSRPAITAQQRRLATAAGSDQDDYLTLGDGQVDCLQHHCLPVTVRDAE